MSEEIIIEQLVHCPISGDLYPYEKCRKCTKYREEYVRSSVDYEFEMVRMMCDYD